MDNLCWTWDWEDSALEPSARSRLATRETLRIKPALKKAELEGEEK